MGIARHFMRRAVDLQHGFPGSHSIDAVGAHHLGQLDFVSVDYSGLIGVLLRLLKFQVGFGGAIYIEYAPGATQSAKLRSASHIADRSWIRSLSQAPA